MYKQSFYIVVIQIIGILLGFMSIYIVAGDMGPEVYSLVGVNTAISALVLTFSHLGIETTMMREALYWMEQGDIEKIREYTTQSILSRLFGFIILSPPIVGYLIFLYYTKYQCQYLFILLSLYIGACVNALNDSMSLIVRSKGDYVFSQAVKTINNSIIKFLSIFVYIFFGAIPYLFFYCLIPIPILFVFFFKINGYFSFKYIQISGTIKKIKESKNLWLTSYMNYFSNSADILLISILFPPALMGVYTIYKNLEGMAKMFIEGFFDVIFQQFVKYKSNVVKLMDMERKANYLRWIVITLILIFTITFSFNPYFFVELANLAKYDYIVIIMYGATITSILYLIGKNEGNIIALFGPSQMLLKLGIIKFFVILFSFLIVIVSPSIYRAILQRFYVFGVSSLINFYTYRSNRLILFNKFCK